MLADILSSVDLLGLAILAWRLWAHHRDEARHNGSEKGMDTNEQL
jgi:hypothetical protein